MTINRGYTLFKGIRFSRVVTVRRSDWIGTYKTKETHDIGNNVSVGGVKLVKFSQN